MAGGFERSVKNLKNRYKLLIVVAIGVLIAGLYFVDVLIADRYDIELVQMTPETVPADGQTSVEITLRVTRNGEVKSGILFTVCLKTAADLRVLAWLPIKTEKLPFSIIPI